MNHDNLRKLIQEKRDASYFFGTVNDTTIKKAEEKLDLTFPKEYRVFLEEYGCGNIGPIEILGLGPNVESVPNVEWVVKNLREKRGLPNYLIPVENIGDGSYAVVSSANSSEHGVMEGVVLQWISRENDPKKIANNFGEYLHERLLNL